jgi:hypothetical protein
MLLLADNLVEGVTNDLWQCTRETSPSDATQSKISRSLCAATVPDSASIFAFVGRHLDLRSIFNGVVKTLWHEKRNEDAYVRWYFGDMKYLLVIC